MLWRSHLLELDHCLASTEFGVWPWRQEVHQPVHSSRAATTGRKKRDAKTIKAAHAVFKWKKKTIFVSVFFVQQTPNWPLIDGRQAWKSEMLMDAPRKWHGLFIFSSSSFSPSPTSCTTPVTILLIHTLGRAGPMVLFSSWSCCTMLDTWASPGLPSPTSGLQKYSGSRTSSALLEASFSPQPGQKQLVT